MDNVQNKDGRQDQAGQENEAKRPAHGIILLPGDIQLSIRKNHEDGTVEETPSYFMPNDAGSAVAVCVMDMWTGQIEEQKTFHSTHEPCSFITAALEKLGYIAEGKTLPNLPEIFKAAGKRGRGCPLRSVCDEDCSHCLFRSIMDSYRLFVVEPEPAEDSEQPQKPTITMLKGGLRE